jgi:hypothetical protein
VTTLAPRAPSAADETFRVAGRLVNCGDEALTGLQVRLVTGTRLSSRSQLRRATDEPVIGTRRLEGQPAQVTDLGAGASTRFDVRVPVADLRLGRRNGVHPLAVQARARTDGGPRGPVASRRPSSRGSRRARSRPRGWRGSCRSSTSRTAARAR